MPSSIKHKTILVPFGPRNSYYLFVFQNDIFNPLLNTDYKRPFSVLINHNCSIRYCATICGILNWKSNKKNITSFLLSLVIAAHKLERDTMKNVSVFSYSTTEFENWASELRGAGQWNQTDHLFNLGDWQPQFHSAYKLSSTVLINELQQFELNGATTLSVPSTLFI